MSRRDRLLIVALLVVLAGLALVTESSRRQEIRDMRPSSYLTSPGGTAALYLALEELGIEPERRLTPYVDDSLHGPLALLAPSEPPTPAELHALAEWIRQGGTLLYAARWRDPTLDTLGIRLEETSLLRSSVLGAAAEDELAGRPHPHPFTAGLLEVGGFRQTFSDSVDALVTPLLSTDEGELLAVEIALGSGRVVAFSDARPLTNRRIGESGAAVLFARAAATAGDAVTFDEYHHGFRPDGSAVAATLRFLRDDPAGHLALQLGAAAIGLLLLAGARFGAPLPPAPVRRRDPLEHVDALAEAYRQAGAREMPRRLLLAGTLRHLGMRAVPGEEETAIDHLKTSLPPEHRDAADELEAEWRRGGEADLVALANALDRVRKEGKRG